MVLAQIASTAATARLIAPSEFGVYATAQAAAGIAGYLILRGVGQDIQRRSTLGRNTVGTALTISLVSSCAVATVMWFGAGTWARMWGVPSASSVVEAFAVVTLLAAMSTVPLGMLRRQLAFRATAITETGSQVIGLASGVALAIALHSALALAIGQTVSYTHLTLPTTPYV